MRDVPDPVPRRLTADARRAQLLDAAVQLAAGRELSALSVHEIASFAGVSEGLLYHYFPTKDALVLAAVQRAADAMTEALESATAVPGLAGLLAGLTAYLDHVQADPTGWRAVLQARTGALAEVGTAVDERSRTLTLAALQVAQASPALQAVLDGWTALERGVCLTWLDQPDLTRRAVEDLLSSSFLAALEAAARHDPQCADVLARLGGE